MFCFQVKEVTLVEALTKKKTTAGGETVVMNYSMADVRLLCSLRTFGQGVQLVPENPTPVTLTRVQFRVAKLVRWWC